MPAALLAVVAVVGRAWLSRSAVDASVGVLETPMA